jgi:putative membrane protein
MKGVARGAALAILAAAWAIAGPRHGMTGHMAAHMAAVAVAAPLLAFGLRGTRFDLAGRWPGVVSPLPMSLLELLVVWAWHMPVTRSFAASGAAPLALEQAMFLFAGLLLWSACLGASDAAVSGRRAAAVIALALTTMHMTLLGVLITLAPRTLFDTHGSAWLGTTLAPLADQQLGGVLMLLVGAASYLIGGLMLLAGLLRAERMRAAER